MFFYVPQEKVSTVKGEENKMLNIMAQQVGQTMGATCRAQRDNVAIIRWNVSCVSEGL